MKVSIHLRYLHQDKGESLHELMKRYPQYSKTSIFRHSNLPITDIETDRRCLSKGRPKKISERDGRKIIRSLHKLREIYGNFSSTDIQRDCSFNEKDISNRTIRRFLKSKGYSYDQCRKKGQLSNEDLQKRLKFA